MIRAVLDTNIYISAILTLGKPRIVLNLARARLFHSCISEPIIQEIERILRIKIQKSTREIRLILNEILRMNEFVSPSRRISLIKEDDADNRVLECAAEGSCDYVISGDRKHLLALKRYKKISIVSAAQFLEIFTFQ